jgi:hypothetical protein
MTGPEALYNLENDIGEANNVIEENPEIAEKLLKEILKFEKELKQNSRSAGFVDNPVSLTKKSK